MAAKAWCTTWTEAPSTSAWPLPTRSSPPGASASVGTVGDSYDNALAETVNGLYKAELIHAKRVWESTEAVELATMGWVHWWNTTRLHEALGYRTPAEVEAAYTHDQDSAPVAS